MKRKQVVANVLSLFLVFMVFVSIAFLVPKGSTRDDLDEFTEPTIQTEATEVTTPNEPIVEIEPPATEPPIEPEQPEQPEVVEDIYLGEFKLTAYCPCAKCCGQWADGITSTGVIAKEGRTIAVDPRVIPYGTEVIINGHTYIAEDCGGAIKGNRIDIYFDSHQEALNFGIQYADIYITGS